MKFWTVCSDGKGKSCSVDADFQKSDLGGCAENEIELPCQLPAIQDMNELKELDSYLREQEIILIIKKHPLQTEWDENEQEFTNIRYVAEALLEKNR